MTKNITITAAYLDARRLGPHDLWLYEPAAKRQEIETAHAVKLHDLLAPFRDALVDAFHAVNGKASSFTLDWSDAINAALEAEQILADKGVPKGARSGTVYTVASAGPSANAYKHAAIGTKFSIRRNAKGDWSLVIVERIDVWPRQAGKAVLTVISAARDAIVKHALTGIEVAPAEGRRVA